MIFALDGPDLPEEALVTSKLIIKLGSCFVLPIHYPSSKTNNQTRVTAADWRWQLGAGLLARAVNDPS